MGRWMRSVLAVGAAGVLLAAAPATAKAALKSIWGPNELPDGRSASRCTSGSGSTSCRSRSGGATWRVAPTNPRDYADFAVATARRYPRVRHWMIWGEPSRAWNFLPQERNGPVGPRTYAELLDRAYGALKAHNRRNIVIGGNTWTLGGEVRPPDFVRWMRLPNGRPPRLDWFGHNPFTTRFPDLRKDTYHPGLRDLSDIDTFVREIRRAYRPVGRAQARWLTAAYRIADRTRYVAGLGWFKLLDDPAPDGLTTGLLTKAGRRKPAYHAYRRAP